MNSGARIPSSPSSSARPKRRNATLGLFDEPVYRDWAFWMTAGWGLIAAASISTSNEPSALPRWLDTLLATIVFIALFGLFPTWLRLVFRRWHEKRQNGPADAMRQGQRVPAQAAPESAPFAQPPPSRAPEPPSRYPSPPSDIAAPPTASELASLSWESLPHPLARAVRALQQAHTPKDRYEAMLEAAEILAITLTVTGAAVLRGQIDGRVAGSDEQRDRARQALTALRNGFPKSATFGTWTNWLDQHLGPIADTQPDLIRGLRSAVRDAGEVPGILTDLRALQNERNRTSHGDKPRSPQESAVRTAEFRPLLERALRKADFLCGARWFLTVSCDYRPRPQTFDVVMRRVTGDHPDFESQSFTWNEPVANDTFYVLCPEGPLPLGPLVASLLCDQCKQMEICYASSIDRRTGTAMFKSFTRGHVISAPELTDELRTLPGHRPPDRPT
ncbi:hypothetical protein ACIBI4_31805 [Streptomyces sp. NPDC050418]|uniref:hypothetical protein n=1 Tax=Streptomyces sp. NPDC050418 TaxID=3365612 RepID=UPI00379A2B85